MRSVIRAERAIRDLEEQSDYLAETSVDTAIRFLEAVEETFRQIAQMPSMGSPQQHKHPNLAGVRVWPVQDFPKHLVFYRDLEDENAVEILRVVHGARNLQVLFEDF